MEHTVPFAPLTLARLYRIPLIKVACKLRVTTDYTRRLARDPEQTRRVVIAELEAILDQMKKDDEMVLVGTALADAPY